jgi:RNA ligase (TIGR02306 family)
MENQDSVCFVGKIDEIKPIPGADNIEQAIIGGWNCIIQKGQYAEGGLVVVATTDAVIPQELSDKLNVTNYLRKGQRVRTVKLRGVYSECLIIPLSFIPKGTNINVISRGKDMMEIMKIFKYEPPVRVVQLGGGRKVRYQDNPNFHVYYKFPNLKNVPNMFTEDQTVEITRKIHGTNARYGIVKKTKLTLLDRIKKLFGSKWIEYEFVIGSHNVEKGSDSNGFYDTNVWYEIENKYSIKELLWAYVKEMGVEHIGNGVTIYGEIYGAGIQKGYDYGLTDIKFVGFDVKQDEDYLDVIGSRIIITDFLMLPYVQILHYGNWSQEVQDKYTFNNFIPNTKVPEEGIVIKYYTGERSKIAKVINPDYLIFSEKNNIGDSH